MNNNTTLRPQSSDVLLSKLIEQKRAVLKHTTRASRKQKVLAAVAKILGWTAAVGSADLAVTHYDNAQKERIEKEREQRLFNRSCELNRHLRQTSRIVYHLSLT